jgi:hypothetical protein
LTPVPKANELLTGLTGKIAEPDQKNGWEVAEFVSPEPVAKPLVLIALADVSVPPGNTPRSVME